ncbi:MAG: capsular biosynthesis protein, partial [Nostocaceae cyanobacterium]|nr:capsular biosynthesis protein [Nostocaceae cyanobacterium]
MQTKEPGFQRFTNRNTSSEPHWNKRIPEGDEDNPGLSEIFALLRRRLVVIGSVALVVTAASIGWTLTRTPKYEGKFQLLVEPLKNSDNQLLVLLSQTLKQNLSEMTKQNTTALDYPALIEVLRSPQLVGPVIEKLQSQYPEITYDPLVGNDAAGKLSNGRLGTLYISRVTKGKDESRVIEVRYQDTNP